MSREGSGEGVWGVWEGSGWCVGGSPDLFQTPTRHPLDPHQTPRDPSQTSTRHPPDPFQTPPDTAQTPLRPPPDTPQTPPRRWIPISGLGLSLLLPGFQNPYVHVYVVCRPLQALLAGHIVFLVIWGLIGQLPSCANLKCLLMQPCSTENQREIYMK